MRGHARTWVMTLIRAKPRDGLPGDRSWRKKKLNVAQEIPAPPKDSAKARNALRQATGRSIQAWLKAEPDQMGMLARVWAVFFTPTKRPRNSGRFWMRKRKPNASSRIGREWSALVLEAEEFRKSKARRENRHALSLFLPGYPAAGRAGDGHRDRQPRRAWRPKVKNSSPTWYAERPTYMRYFYVYTYARILGDDAARRRSAPPSLSAEAIKELQPPPPRRSNMIVVDVASLDDLYTSVLLPLPHGRAYALKWNDYATCLQICGASGAEDDKAEPRPRDPRATAPSSRSLAAANLAAGRLRPGPGPGSPTPALIANHGGVMWAGDLEPPARRGVCKRSDVHLHAQRQTVRSRF